MGVEASFGTEFPGTKDVVYVNGPVLCGFVASGGGRKFFLNRSLSPFVAGAGVGVADVDISLE